MRWTGSCSGCHREREVETRYDHAAKVLCDECAARPHPPPTAPPEREPSPAETGNRDASSAGRTVVLTPASEIRSERVRWLDRPRVPLRGVVVIAGEKGLGKSIFTNAKFIADVTRGKLDGEVREPRDVLLVSGEDDWRAVIKPRLMAHGADVDRVHRVEVLDAEGDSLLTLPGDAQIIERAIRDRREQGREVALLVIDPLNAFLSSSTDTHRDASVRRAIAPLAAMADRASIAVVVVAHLTKDESARYINRVGGSGAFVNAARSLLVMARHPEDPDGEQGYERVLVHVASNWGRLAPSLHLRVEVREVDLEDGSRDEIGFIHLLGETDLGVEDLQRRDETGPEDVEEAIGAALADGGRPSQEVKAQVAKDLKVSARTVERAAGRMIGRRELSVTSERFPRRTIWSLSSHDTDDAPVTTTPSSDRVVTDEYGVVTGDSVPSHDTQGVSNGRVVTGAPEGFFEGVEEANRTRSKPIEPAADEDDWRQR